ncbi:MAG: helix-turn-helix transcriptional regulator [Candidatus Aminicenantes bacterium]|nr:helix-turn-helix transcriptional regulator [Candidatus Aminicenantes bacterium]
MKHFNVLTTVLILIVGVWAVVEFRQRSRRFPGSKLDNLGLFLVFYNGLALAVFFSTYGQSNLTPAQLSSLSFWYKFVEWPVLTALTVGVHISLYRAIFRRRDKDLPKWVVPVVGVFGVAVIAWYFLALRYPALTPHRPENTFWLALVWPLGLLDMFWLGRLLAESRKAADPGQRRVDGAFALLFLARYPLHLALSVWNPGGAVFVALALSKLLGLYTNLLPGIWLKAYFGPWAGSLGKVLGEQFNLAAIGQARGVSAREMEILELMIDGKSYKEIESALHISIHTVKSHVYSLYRKMDVKSRHQLIHQIGVYGGTGAAAPTDRPARPA